jgi:hypothetical protein
LICGKSMDFSIQSDHKESQALACRGRCPFNSVTCASGLGPRD